MNRRNDPDGKDENLFGRLLYSTHSSNSKDKAGKSQQAAEGGSEAGKLRKTLDEGWRAFRQGAKAVGESMKPVLTETFRSIGTLMGELSDMESLESDAPSMQGAVKSPPPKALLATNEQIDAYIRLRHEQERQRAEAPWRACFESNAHHIQQLMALKRWPEEGLPGRVEDILEKVSGLTDKGFAVQSAEPQPVHEALLRERCAGLTQAEMDSSIALLRHELYDIPLDYQSLVMVLGSALADVRRALQADASALTEAITTLNDALASQGVLACFSDDEEIMASHELRIRCFTDVSEGAAELPGLFYRSASGKLTCIGRFAGTRRVAEDP